MRECSLRVTAAAVASTFINGNKLVEEEAHPLKHLDRMFFGQNFVFVFMDPSAGSTIEEVLQQISFEGAAKECAEKQGHIRFKTEEEIAEEKRKHEEYESKVREAEIAKAQAENEAKDREAQREAQYKAQLDLMEKERSRMEAKEKEAMKAVYERKLRLMKEEVDKNKKEAEAAAARKAAELEEKRRQLEQQEIDRRQREVDTQLLDEQLMVVMPVVKEANLIAKELQKPYEFKTKLHVHAVDSGRRRTDVVVEVQYCGHRVYEWAPSVLENRIFLMRELFEKWCDDGEVDVSEELDPYWDPVQEEHLIGTARLYLESLTMQLDNPFESRIMSPEGKPVGTLHCGVYPLSKDGSLEIPDEELIDDPTELIGTRFAFLLRVDCAKALPH